MVRVEDLSRLVSGVYDAAVRPAVWADAIRDMHQFLGGVGGILLAGDGGGRAVPIATTLPEEAGQSYAEYYCQLDNEVRYMQQGPVGVVRSSRDLMAPARNAEFYSEWMRPLDLEDGLFVRLTRGEHPVCLVLGFPRPMGYLSAPERVKVLTGLVPHLQQALRTQARLGAAAERADHLAEALALHRHGIVIVGPGLLVLEANPAAERMLARHDGLLVDHGRITARREGSSVELRRAAHLALIGDDDGVRSGTTLLCRRPSGERPYVVHVLPLARSVNLPGPVTAHPAAMVVIVDPDQDVQPPVPLLQRLYRLTQAEAEVAVRIARGTDVKHIADELCVSLPTVRTHLQHLYDKTDTHRQAELIRLLLAIAP